MARDLCQFVFCCGKRSLYQEILLVWILIDGIPKLGVGPVSPLNTKVPVADSIA
jgi:hypothetical protein